MDKGPNYATALLPEFYARARCPPSLTPFGGAAVKVYGWEKESLQAKRFRFFFLPLFLRHVWLREGEPLSKVFQTLHFFNFFLSSFLFSFDDQSGMVAWTYL